MQKSATWTDMLLQHHERVPVISADGDSHLVVEKVDDSVFDSFLISGLGVCRIEEIFLPQNSAVPIAASPARHRFEQIFVVRVFVEMHQIFPQIKVDNNGGFIFDILAQLQLNIFSVAHFKQMTPQYLSSRRLSIGRTLVDLLQGIHLQRSQS
jgi:hypothetical protein